LCVCRPTCPFFQLLDFLEFFGIMIFKYSTKVPPCFQNRQPTTPTNQRGTAMAQPTSEQLTISIDSSDLALITGALKRLTKLSELTNRSISDLAERVRELERQQDAADTDRMEKLERG